MGKSRAERKKPKSQESRDAKACSLAEEYLLGFEQVTPEMLERYLAGAETDGDVSSMPGVYRQLVRSAQNKNMSPAVIESSIGNLERLGPILCRFRPDAVVKKYGTDSGKLLADIVKRLRPTGRFRPRPGRRSRG